MAKIGRKNLLKLSAAGGGAALASVILGKGLGSGLARASGRQLRLDVATDLTSFNNVPAVNQLPGGPFPTGPFYVEGPIFPNGTLDATGDPGGAASTGTFRCWGWIINGSGIAAVSQAYELDGWGEIQVQGLEDGSRAITGGTGHFINVRGEGSFEFINPENLSFHAAFTLRGAGA